MRETERPMSKLAVLFNILVCLLILAAGAGAFAYFMQNKVSAKKVRRPPRAPLVETIEARRSNVPMQLKAMGTVTPSREIVLKPEVSGTVQEISPNLTPGGRITAGELLVRLDPRQYELEVTKREIGVQSAEADLALEQGQQVVAREELKMLSAEEGGLLQTDLALRKPQLLQAKAALESARADLEQARLDLSRTELRAPFNALVTDRQVNTGSQVSPGNALATLVGTDEFWVQAALPLDVLARLNLEQPGGVPVTLRPQAGSAHWEGRLVRLAGELTEETMMATGIVVVPGPLSPADPGQRPLILGEYVSLEFPSEPLEDVFALPRGALREGGTVWVLAGKPGKRRLEALPVTPLGTDHDRVFIRQGLEEGARVIVSELTGALDGMQVAVEGDPEPASSGENAAKGNHAGNPAGRGAQ